jgi:hypothetical protein
VLPLLLYWIECEALEGDRNQKLVKQEPKASNLAGAIIDLVNSLRADSKVDDMSSSAAMSATAMNVMMIRELKAVASDRRREERKCRQQHKKRKKKARIFGNS